MTIAKKALDELNEVDDYTCTFVKRERVDGELLDEQTLEMKVRHEPFSVYMRFLAPESLAGQQAIYVEGANDNKLLGRAAGLRGKILGWLSLNPSGYLAMMGNRHPITDAGMKNLVAQLMELGETPGLLDDCRVSFRSGAKIDGRACTRLEIRNSKVRGDFKLAIARIWIDKERNFPLRFEAFEWPEEGEGEPVLVERYTYRDLEIDVGLSDRDFEVENPDYAGK